MQVTVYGRHMDINVPADQIGRYAIDSLKGDVSKAALDFGNTLGRSIALSPAWKCGSVGLVSCRLSTYFSAPRLTMIVAIVLARPPWNCFCPSEWSRQIGSS